MTLEILLVYSILIISLILFLTAWIRMDIVALLVLSVLTISGLVTPSEALAGFSNPAVITVWAMYVLSAGLYQTGVARIIGRQMIYASGKGEMRMIFIIMLTSGLLSSIMNNTGVAALMLPVVMDIARSTNRPPSRLLIPLAYGIMLGGLITLIGSPPNLLASFALQDAGFEPFRLFDYAPLGLAAMLTGILFMVLIGRHLLPKRDLIREEGTAGKKALPASYALKERTFLMRLNPKSGLIGKTLAQSRFRPALGINILSIKRKNGETILNPHPETLLNANDVLFVQGRLEAIKTFRKWTISQPKEKEVDLESLSFENFNFFEAAIDKTSPLSGQCVEDPHIKKLLNVNVLAIKQGGKIRQEKLYKTLLGDKDILLLQGSHDEIQSMVNQGIFTSFNKLSARELGEIYNFNESVFIAQPDNETLETESSLGDIQLFQFFGLNVVGIIRGKERFIMPKSDEVLLAGDQLIIRGNSRNLPLLHELPQVELLKDPPPGPQSLEEGELQMAEAVLAPRSLLAGMTLTEINFRQKYDLTVLAIWKKGQVFRTNLHKVPLEYGEAFLLYGKRSKLEMLGTESNFILLTDTMRKTFRTNKALISVLIMAVILIPVMLGLIPLAIMAVTGIALMVLSGCLKMEEAYRAIEWRSVFLIAGLLPLGAAMHKTGAAALLANGLIEVFGNLGQIGVISALYLLSVAFTLVIPPAAIVVIMSPVAIQAALSYGINPHSVMMALVMAAAPSFLSPVSQPASHMMMGPGGYKFIDYIKTGLPVTFFVMIVVLILLPVFWPF